MDSCGKGGSGWKFLFAAALGRKILGEKKHSSQTAAAAVWLISKAAVIRYAIVDHQEDEEE